MRNFVVFTALAGALLTMGACADIPTLPEQQYPRTLIGGPVQDQQLQGCVSDGVCVLEPISPAPCDPWMDLNWCEGEGGNCMTSSLPGQTVQSCPGPGGGAPGGGAPPPPIGDPGTTCPTAATSTCPSEPPPPDSCVTNDPVINNPAVEAGFAGIWAKSNADAPQSERVEQAAWIVQTSYGLDIIPWTNADFGPCTITPHIGTFAIPTNAVGWMHTHPFTEGEVQTSCDPLGYDANGQPIHGTYSSFPNPEDIELASGINASLGRNIDAYTIDRGKIVRFLATGSTTASAYESYGRCGY